MAHTTTLSGVESLRSGLTFVEAREAAQSCYGGGAIVASLAADHLSTAARTHEMAHAAADTAGIVGEQGRVPTPNYRTVYPSLAIDLSEDLVVETIAAKAGLRGNHEQAEAVIGFFRQAQRESERKASELAAGSPEAVQTEAHVRYCKGKVSLAGAVSGLRSKAGIPAIATGLELARQIAANPNGDTVGDLRERLVAGICAYLGLKPKVEVADDDGDEDGDEVEEQEVKRPRRKEGTERTESKGNPTVEITYVPFIAGTKRGGIVARQRVRRRGDSGAVLSDRFVECLASGDASHLTRQDRYAERPGCVVVVDCSGSMAATVARLGDILDACPAASVYCYSGNGQRNPIRGAIYCLAYRGVTDRRYSDCARTGGAWATVSSILHEHGGLGGNDIDAAAIAYAMSRHPREACAVLTDGAFCGGVWGQVEAANALCATAAYTGTIPQDAARALKAAARKR